MRTAIYGLFDVQGVCLYVGRSCKPAKRERVHKLKGIAFSVFKIFEWVESKAEFVEGNYIRKFKAIGQASLNIRTNKTTSATVTFQDVADRVRNLRIGQSFNVTTDRERRDAPVAGQVLGKRLATRYRKTGGYTVTALPE